MCYHNLWNWEFESPVREFAVKVLLWETIYVFLVIDDTALFK